MVAGACGRREGARKEGEERTASKNKVPSRTHSQGPIPHPDLTS